MKKNTLGLLVAVVAALGLVVSGCGGGDNDNKSADGTPSSSSSSTDGSAPSGTSSEGATPEGTDFTVREGLPKNFPGEDIPLVKGKVLSGIAGAFAPSGEQVKGWTVRVKASGKPDAALKSAGSLLKGKGYAKDKKIIAGQETWTNSDYTVIVKTGATPSKKKGKSNPTVAIYTIITK